LYVILRITSSYLLIRINLKNITVFLRLLSIVIGKGFPLRQSKGNSEYGQVIRERYFLTISKFRKKTYSVKKEKVLKLRGLHWTMGVLPWQLGRLGKLWHAWKRALNTVMNEKHLENQSENINLSNKCLLIWKLDYKLAVY